MAAARRALARAAERACRRGLAELEAATAGPRAGAVGAAFRADLRAAGGSGGGGGAPGWPATWRALLAERPASAASLLPPAARAQAVAAPPPPLRRFGTSAARWQQLQQTPPPKPPPMPPMPLGTAAGQLAARPAPEAELADASDCDEALEDLEETRQRVARAERLRRPPPGQVPLGARLRGAAGATASGLAAAARWVASVPGKLGRFAALPRAERRARYAAAWASVKKEARHYWLGTKLLGKDAAIAARLARRVLAGRTLTRRERAQLTRTTADLFRLVPMLVFVVVPFMELLLPVALKLFPNMLPSTFEDELKREEALKRRVAARLEVAEFLQDTVAEMADEAARAAGGGGRGGASAAELYAFMKRVRAGADVAPAQLLQFAPLFSDALTLDNLGRAQLVSLCRFVGIQPFGTDAFLRARLRAHLRAIKDDDVDIRAEGLDAMTEAELRDACRARGMRAPFGEGAAPFMRAQLEEWLDWSLDRALPSSLLLLSRAVTLTAPARPGGGAPPPVPLGDAGALRDTLCTLPDEAVEDVELYATTGAPGEDAYERRLELLAREEELIREEAAEAAHAASAAAEAAALPSGEGGAPEPPSPARAQAVTAAAAAAAVLREAAAGSLADALLEGESEEERAARAAAARAARMRKVITALAALASSSGVSSERERFMDLVETEIERLNAKLEGAGAGAGMVFTRAQLKVDRPARGADSVGAARLADRVAGILTRVEKELDAAEGAIGSRLRLLDADGDGVVSAAELRAAMGFLREQLGEDELRALLETLSAGAGAHGAGVEGGIDVARLMELAQEAEEEEERAEQ